MGPFNVTFNDFFWVAVAFFLIPPAVKLFFQVLIRVGGWFFMLRDHCSIESRLLEATRRYERLFRGRRQS
jgi:hypothetical protein